MPRLGILGLPNVGKTTLFNALTASEAATASHPFSTTEPNLGVATIPDPRLDEAAALEGSKKVVHATLDLVDLPPIHGPGGGLSGQEFGRLREADGLVVVLRAFDDPSIPDAESGTDPVTQAETLLLDLVLVDAEMIARRSERAAKEATADPARRREADTLARAAAVLADERPLRSVDWSADELAVFRDTAPATLLPTVWVVNVAEEEKRVDDLTSAVVAVVPSVDRVISLSARLEEEGARLDPADRAELFDGLGLGPGALASVVGATYSMLGLISFFTLAPKESRARTLREGASAWEAAGKIHSDMQRGFIRAEVAPIEVVVDAGGWEAAKSRGAVRVEGRDYRVGDGDVLFVRFSV